MNILSKKNIFALICFLLMTNSYPSVKNSSSIETRCGWFKNPTPSNVWLVDQDNEWLIAKQGDYQAEGNWPHFSDKQWVKENGNYGYGCACMRVIVDYQNNKILRIFKSWAKPLSACEKDKAIHSSLKNTSHQTAELTINESLWKRIDTVNIFFVNAKKPMATNSLGTALAEAKNILRDTEFSGEYDNIIENAHDKNNFTHVKALTKRATPTFRILFNDTHGDGGVDFQYVKALAIQNSEAYEFFQLILITLLW